MVDIPDYVMEELNDNPRAGRVLGTKSVDGSVHIIPVGSLRAINPSIIVAGAVLMNRSSKNLENMKAKDELASILILNAEKMLAYEIRAKPKEYQSSGPILEKMNDNMRKLGIQARGVWLLEVAEVWNQSATYEAGKRIA